MSLCLDTPESLREDEHEGKNVKVQCDPDLIPVVVRSPVGPHLVFHVSRCTPVSSLMSDVIARAGVPEGFALGACGVAKDTTLCMTARCVVCLLLSNFQQRGAALGGAGQWFCVACQLGDCYAIKSHARLCSELFPVPNKRQARVVPLDPLVPAFRQLPTIELSGWKGIEYPIQVGRLRSRSWCNCSGCSTEVMNEVRLRVSGTFW